jgi:hypothetical protein
VCGIVGVEFEIWCEVHGAGFVNDKFPFDARPAPLLRLILGFTTTTFVGVVPLFFVSPPEGSPEVVIAFPNTRTI